VDIEQGTTIFDEKCTFFQCKCMIHRSGKKLSRSQANYLEQALFGSLFYEEKESVMETQDIPPPFIGQGVFLLRPATAGCSGTT